MCQRLALNRVSFGARTYVLRRSAFAIGGCRRFAIIPRSGGRNLEPNEVHDDERPCPSIPALVSRARRRCEVAAGHLAIMRRCTLGGRRTIRRCHGGSKVQTRVGSVVQIRRAIVVSRELIAESIAFPRPIARIRPECPRQRDTTVDTSVMEYRPVNEFIYPRE